MARRPGPDKVAVARSTVRRGGPPLGRAVLLCFDHRVPPAPYPVRVHPGRVGAVGVSGDTSDNDEAAALAGIEAAGLVAETGG